MGDLGVGPGPVISVARPSLAKTRRLQNICATHPQPELTGGVWRLGEAGRADRADWEDGGGDGDIPESG